MDGFLDILKDCFRVLFTGPLYKVLMEVQKFWVMEVGKIFLEYLSIILYDWTVAVLHFLSAVERFQRSMLGIENIVITESGRVDLISALMDYGKFNLILLQFIGISLLLTAVFAIRRLFNDIAKDNSDKQPISTFIRRLIQCWGRLCATFLYCTCILNFVRVGSCAIVDLTGCKQPNMANIIFVMGAQNSVRDVSQKQAVLNRYIDPLDTIHTFSKSASIAKDFYKSDINYLIIFICAIVLLIVMIKVTIKLARRLIVLVVLYLIGPFFAAMSLLEGKEKSYEDWKGMFIANFTQGMIVLIGYFAFVVIASEIASTGFIRISSSEIVNSFLGMVTIICVGLSIPNSFRFGYNLLTDKGRFLDNDIPSLKDITQLTR